ncbi:Protein of unknown function (DUF2561) [Mycolicibacterium chubuense NBB4]|uniref:Transmembrane protein n=1 Tax=Mycolicibacterium chubuense (strain NBB4) TaxID=710421 RepID=I4BKZ2_MYCCN|nr:DUF2561 family protein [Mycolicibacterium chubuense]AFM17949.1 Protein of unknown function (DUF2561) [Mycolicibacterium chubuense NBB4]
MTAYDPGNRPQPDAGFDLTSLDRTDRALLGGGVLVWLGALGAGVAATVVLVNLARGHTETSGSGTPWYLYVVIVVSAVVIAGAIPLLLRARRVTQTQAAEGEPRTPLRAEEPQVRATDAPTEKLRTVSPTPLAAVSGPLPVLSPEFGRLWLRCTAAIVGAMGLATLLVGVATYLMAVGSDTVAWVLYAFAGLVTVAMCALPWYFLREMRAELED